MNHIEWKLHNYFNGLNIYLNGVVSGVLSVVVVVFVLVEDTRAAVKLNLDLGSDGALEVDNPQGRLLADGDVLNLKQ